MRHACPCCGYRIHDQPVGGSMQICAVCFWEDAPGEPRYNGSNKVSLVEAQRNFRDFGASEGVFSDIVRPPACGETRDPHWRSSEAQAIDIINLIETAFAAACLGEGITIHQREVIDGYGSQQEFEAARGLDAETRWQDIPDGKIGKFGTTLTFLDPKSIRYHLPAFMRFVLRHWLTSNEVGNGDMVLYSLSDGPQSVGYHADSFTLLNPAEKQATATFLQFISIVDSLYGIDAEKGLKNGWAAWLDHTP